MGGACNGLEQAGLSCVLAIDNDSDGPCIETRAKNLNCDKGIKLDIHKYFDEAKKDEHGKDIFLLWTSPPCKKFSMIKNWEGAKRTGDKSIEDLYKESLKFIEWARPKFVVMENVKGIINYEAQARVAGKAGKISEIWDAFDKLGYGVEWQVLNAARFGCAQQRERVMFVASRDPKLRGLIPSIKDPKWVYFSDIRERGAIEWCLSGESYRTMNEKLSRIIKKHHSYKIRIIGLDRDKGTSRDFLPTITCGFGGGVTRKRCAIVDKIRTKGISVPFLRNPTLLEAVRAQGFPDSWMDNLPKSTSLAWNMVGNAVPSPISKAIAEHLIKVDRGENPPAMGAYDLPAPPKEVQWE